MTRPTSAAARKKILFIPRWYPDRHDSMLGLFIQKHAQAVQQQFDVTVLYVTADATLPPGKSLWDEQEFHGIRELRVYFGKHRSTVTNAFAYMKYYSASLSRLLSAGNPDICHVHVLSRTAIPALWLKITKGIPYLITEHWSRYLPVNLQKGAYRGWLRKWFTRFAVSRAYAVTAVTENLAVAMQRLGLKNEYFVIPNVADTGDFYPEKEKKVHDIKKLVHVSCFDEPAKNVKGIINVIKLLSGKRNDFTLEIIGDGHDFNEVKDYAVAAAIPETIMTFTGLLTGDELSRSMREADAFVMFSNYENLPCTIVESLCSGVPVISTDVGGIREHITPEFGILVKPGNEAELADAINSVLDKKYHFDPAKMRRYSEENFSMESVGKQFATVYMKSGRV